MSADEMIRESFYRSHPDPVRRAEFLSALGGQIDAMDRIAEAHPAPVWFDGSLRVEIDAGAVRVVGLNLYAVADRAAFDEHRRTVGNLYAVLIQGPPDDPTPECIYDYYRLMPDAERKATRAVITAGLDLLTALGEGNEATSDAEFGIEPLIRSGAIKRVGDQRYAVNDRAAFDRDKATHVQLLFVLTSVEGESVPESI